MIVRAWRWFLQHVWGHAVCCACGFHESETLRANGWRWGTMHDGKARWLCPDCSRGYR